MRTVRGLVISTVDYKDNDKLLKILVKDEGVITLYGRGMNKINSKNNANAMPFMISDFVIEEHDVKKILQLRSCVGVEMYRAIREDIVKNIIASLMCEYACGIESENTYDIYDFMVTSLETLRGKENPLLVYSIFLAKVSDVLGVKPFVDGCIRCNSSKSIAYFSLKDGGFVCESCNREGMHDQIEYLKMMRIITKADYEHISKIASVDDILEMVIDTYHEFLKMHGGIHVKGGQLLSNVLHL